MIKFGDEMIGRSVLNCILIEEEDDMGACAESEEQIQSDLRKIRSLFNAMDLLEIRRISPEVFRDIMSTFYVDESYNDKLEHDDKAQVMDIVSLLEDAMEDNQEGFELGEPELEVVCSQECRGSTRCTHTEEDSNGVRVVLTERPDNCLFKNWL